MAETIFMIHGMWGGTWCWENYSDHLTDRGFDCIVPSLRFHGAGSEVPPDPELGTTSLLDYADDLELEIRRLGAPPVVMGHSMGGLLAQILGSRGLARALVLLAPASPAGIQALRPSVIRGFWSVQTQWGFWRKPIRQTYAEAAYSILHMHPPEERRRIYDRFGYESGRAAFEIGYWLLDRRKASRVDASRVTCPVLVVAGKEDRMTPASVVRRIAGKYGARATFREFDHHAHWVLSEPGWQVIADHAANWIERESAGSADVGPRVTI